MDMNLIRNLNEPILKKQLVSLKKGDLSSRKGIPTKGTVEEIADLLGVDPNDLYVIEKTFQSYCYYRYPVFCEIQVFTPEAIHQMRVKERIDHISQMAQAFTEKNDWSSLMASTSQNAWILLLNDLYWNVPDANKHDLYQEVYTLSDYGVYAIDEAIHRDVSSHMSSRKRERMLSRLDQYEEGDSVTIYRGIGSESIAPDQAMSWTLRLNVAAFFATRIRADQKATVYKAKVKKENITMYNSNRREEEVLVIPEHVEKIEIISQDSLYNELDILQNEGYMDEYFLYKNTFMKPEHYHRAKGIHGVDHVKRVLFHAISLSRVLGLSSRDRAILANASLYHDIRREHDGYCTEHGFWSWKWYHENLASRFPLVEVNCVDRWKRGVNSGYDIEKLTLEDVKIVGFLVEYHCIEDDEAEKALRSKHLHPSTHKRCWRLFQFFKECDALDRVRLPINELDVRYFRTKEAVNRVSYAYQVFNNTASL